MSGSDPTTTAGESPAGPEAESIRLKFGHRIGIMAIITVLLLVGSSLLPSTPARAGGEAQPGGSPSASFAVGVETTLNRHRDEIIKLAEEVLAATDVPPRLQEELASQLMTVKTAEANYENARLARRLAAIAVTEYQEGIFVQELATADGEIRLARNEAEKAKDDIKKQKDRLTKIKRASKETAADLASEYVFEDRVLNAELQLRRAGFALEQAESKRKVLTELKKPKRLLELQTDVERTKADELAKQGAWELERVKEERMRKEARRILSDPERRVLALLDQAVSLDEQARGKLEQFQKYEKPDDSLQKEIQSLANQLQAVVEQAIRIRDEERTKQSEAHYSDLKRRIKRAASRNPSEVPR